MIQDLYHRAILDAAAAAVGAGELLRPDGRARVDNPLCGDRVEFDVCTRGDKVSELAHRVRGCVLCEAAASVISGSAQGLSARDLAAVRASVAAMLEGGPWHFQAPWAGLEMFAPARHFPSRHECVTLAFDAIAAALSDAESREDGSERCAASCRSR